MLVWVRLRGEASQAFYFVEASVVDASGFQFGSGGFRFEFKLQANSVPSGQVAAKTGFAFAENVFKFRSGSPVNSA